MKVSFNGLLLPGLKTVFRLDGEFSKDELVCELLSKWVPFGECQHCPRWPDNCEYAKRNPAQPHRSIEIRCGVGENLIKNIVSFWFDTGKLKNAKQQSGLLNALYHMCQFSMNASVEIANITNAELFNQSPEQFSIYTFGRFLNLRDHLNSSARYGSHIDGFAEKSLLVMVEGQTEQFFLRYYIDLSRKYYSFDSVTVETYGGAGNAAHNRIPLLLKIKESEGYICCLQGDLDGDSHSQKINSLINSGALEKENVFLFKFDFESSFPKEWILEWLTEFEHVDDVSKSAFVEIMDDNSSIITQVKSKLGLDIGPLKMDLCKYLTVKLITQELSNNDSLSPTHEIYQFLDFIDSMNKKCRHKNQVGFSS